MRLKYRIADALAAGARTWKAGPLAGWVLGRKLIDLCLLPDDIRTINRTYFEIFGKKPNLVRPTTFNEKIQSAKLFARRSKSIQMTDKLLVRDFVSSRLGDRIGLPKIYWSGTDLMAARTVTLPSKFMIKANQASGNNIVVRDSATLDWAAAAEKTRLWLKQDFSALFAEWQYRWIVPRIFIEEFIQGPNDDIPHDYRFFCFAGQVEVVGVRADVSTHVRRALFNRDFERLPVTVLPAYPAYEGVPPRGFKQMIEIAETLSKGEPFARIDLYEGEPPVFGEITLSPGAGIEKFDPPEWDLKLGMLWR